MKYMFAEMYIADIYTGDKSEQPLHAECWQGEQTVQYKMKRGCNQPESVELLVSWLMTDAKRILSCAPCLWFAPRTVPTGERTLAGLQTPRCTAAPPAHGWEQARAHTVNMIRDVCAWSYLFPPRTADYCMAWEICLSRSVSFQHGNAWG